MTATTAARHVIRMSGDSDPLISLRTAYDNGWPHPQTLRRYIHEGDLAAVKVGKSFMVRESDLQRLVTPVAVGGSVSDLAGDCPRPVSAPQDSLETIAARLVLTWPELSPERRRELGRLLAAA